VSTNQHTSTLTNIHTHKRTQLLYSEFTHKYYCQCFYCDHSYAKSSSGSIANKIEEPALNLLCHRLRIIDRRCSRQSPLLLSLVFFTWCQKWDMNPRPHSSSLHTTTQLSFTKQNNNLL